MTRGGKRDGAGRPTKDGIPRKRVTVALREDLLAELVRQAEALGISLADHINHLLVAQLQLSSPAEVQVETNIAQTPAPLAGQGDDLAMLDQMLKQVDDIDRELATMPLDADEAEAVPTCKELEILLRRWTSIHINRRSNEIQYWRKHYRQDKSFREAMDHLAAWTHERFRDLLLDNRLPLATHDEALALSVLPAKVLKITAARLLKGERDLKQALRGYEEAFRQVVTQRSREKDPSHSAYYFSSELGF